MKYLLQICLVVTSLLIISCQKDENASMDVTKIIFNATINSNVEYDVKAETGSNFATGSYNMGLWVCDANKTPSYASPLMEEFRNCKIEYTRNGNGEPDIWSFYGNGKNWNNSIAVDNGRALDIFSYMPWNENVTDITSIPFSTGAEEYMWCDPVSVTQTQTSGEGVLNVNLNYRHIMTCIEVSVKSNVNDAIMLDEITLKDITGTNIAASGTYNAINGKISTEDGLMVDQITAIGGKMLTNDDTTPKICFKIPEYKNYNSNNFELSFKFNGIDGATKFIIPSTITNNGKLESGKKYIVTLQLNEAMKFSVLEFRTADNWNSEIQNTDIEL